MFFGNNAQGAPWNPFTGGDAWDMAKLRKAALNAAYLSMRPRIDQYRREAILLHTHPRYFPRTTTLDRCVARRESHRDPNANAALLLGLFLARGKGFGEAKGRVNARKNQGGSAPLFGFSRGSRPRRVRAKNKQGACFCYCSEIRTVPRAHFPYFRTQINRTLYTGGNMQITLNPPPKHFSRATPLDRCDSTRESRRDPRANGALS